jgi:prepilin-type processing-associated H-X9-DG protein
LGVNCLYIDGHAAKTRSLDITIYDLGANYRDIERGTPVP